MTLAAIAIAYLALVWLPGRREIRAVREEVRTKRQYVNQSTGLTKTLIAAEKELIAAEAVVNKWAETAPGNKDLPPLFGQINALAKQSGLAVTRFDPEPFVVHEEFREIPLLIGCSGKYAQIFEYLRSIEKQPMSIWVEFLRLDKADDSSENVKCELNMVVFSDNPDSSDFIKQRK